MKAELNVYYWNKPLSFYPSSELIKGQWIDCNDDHSNYFGIEWKEGIIFSVVAKDIVIMQGEGIFRVLRGTIA